MYQELIGKKIRQLRDKKAWTQEHLAKAAGISLRTVQRAEEGAMSAETLTSLASTFDVPVEQLSHDESAYRLDVLYGKKAIDPRLAVRLSGTA